MHEKFFVELVPGSFLRTSARYDQTGDDALERWFETFDDKGGAGVFFVAKKGDDMSKEGLIMVLHHLLVLEGSSIPDMVGIESLEASAVFAGVNLVELRY